MRILHIGKYYAPERGGIERYLQEIAEWQVAHGASVRVLVHQRPGQRANAQEVMQGVEVQRVGCIAAPLYTPLSPSFPRALGRAIGAFDPDVLHLHFPNPSCFFALLSASARQRPWIVHWHADVSPEAPDWRLRLAYRAYRPFEQAVLARACAIVATSRPYLDASTALAPWREKTQVIPLGIATSGPVEAHAANPTDRSLSRWPQPSGLRLLAVGRLSHYKGFAVLFAALAQVADATLLLVGGGEMETALRAQARTLGIESRITFAGQLDDADLLAAYAHADAFVLPSLDRSEAFGLVLLEAMRAGLPVIASAIPGSGVGYVVEDGRTGILVPSADIAALAESIRTCRDPALRSRMGEAGRQRFASGFTLERSAAMLQTLYANCVGRG